MNFRGPKFDSNKRLRPSKYLGRNFEEQCAPVLDRYKPYERGFRSMAII